MRLTIGSAEANERVAAALREFMGRVMFERVALIGLGLIGSSLAHAVKRERLAETIAGYDISEAVRHRAAALELAAIAPTAADVVKGADLVILCSPVGSYRELAAAIAPHLRAGAILSDVGSVKNAVLRMFRRFVPKGVHFLPAHPIAGTEQSGPDAGFSEPVRSSLVHHHAARPAPIRPRWRSSSTSGKAAAARWK